MSQPRKSFSTMLTSNLEVESVLAAFDKAEAAAELGPLPLGSYVAVAESSEMRESRNGHPCLKVRFRVVEGEYQNRCYWHPFYLSEKAIAYTKRDLQKLGIRNGEQLQAGVSRNRYVCRLELVVHVEDDGSEKNQMKSFAVIREQTPEPNPYDPEVTDANGEGER